MAWTFEATRPGYLNMWASAVIRADERAVVDAAARKIIAGEARYKAVEKLTDVPWYFIGALHMRESGCDFRGVLHNGDQIIGKGTKTYRVPVGRGPFATWEEAAVDALKLKDLHKVKDWGPARFGYHAEIFNGLGYVGKGVNSPYVWGGSNHEQRGKYIADHVWSSTAVDVQVGVMTAIKALCEMRPDIAASVNGKPAIVPPVATATAVVVAAGTTAAAGAVAPAVALPIAAFVAGVVVTLLAVWWFARWRDRRAAAQAMASNPPPIVSVEPVTALNPDRPRSKPAARRRSTSRPKSKPARKRAA